MSEPPAASKPRRTLDLAVAAALALLAAILAGTLPQGSLFRAAVTLPILLAVPGYLLIEATVTSHRPGQRALHALAGVGVGPAVVGLLALLTVFLPGGFSGTTIVGTVTAACLGLAALAAWRRLRKPETVAPPVAADA